MKTQTIRNVPKRLVDALDRERRRKGASLNSTVLELLSRSLGADGRVPLRNGLAKLAGTWDAKELQEFEAAIADWDGAPVGREFW